MDIVQHVGEYAQMLLVTAATAPTISRISLSNRQRIRSEKGASNPCRRERDGG
jgi:hypothetical protein